MSEAQPPQPQALAESLRAAVARTLEATARPAGPARERAAELVDEVVQRGRGAGEELTRRGQGAGAELARRRQDVGAELARRRQGAEGTFEELSRRGQDVGGELVRRGQGAGEAIARRIGELIERARPEREGRASGEPKSKPQAEG